MVDIGKNIKYLRNMHNETQQQLADALGKGYSNKMISKYERGQPIDPEALNKIAAHYCTTVDDLISNDYSDISLPDRLVSIKDSSKTFEILFPLIPPTSEDALFNRGYTLTQEFFIAFSHINIASNDASFTTYYDQLYDALDLFKQSAEKHDNLESKANFVVISLMLWNFIYVANTDAINININSFLTCGIPIPETVTGISPIYMQTFDDWNSEQVAFYKDKESIINQYLKILKRTHYSDFADYCMFLKYAVCMQESYSGIESQNISYAMLDALMVFENPYAQNYYNNIIQYIE